MFDDIIDAFIDEGGTRGRAVEVTPMPAGRTRNEDSPRVDAGLLLQKIGITDPNKTRFVVDTLLGFDAAKDLYRTDVEAWTNLKATYNDNLKPKDIDLLAGLCTWYGTFSTSSPNNSSFFSSRHSQHDPGSRAPSLQARASLVEVPREPLRPS